MASYQQSTPLTVALTTGQQALESGTYIATGPVSTGSLQVNLVVSGIPTAGGWRFQGDTAAFHAGGTAVSNLAAGDYILEFQPVIGFDTPPFAEVVVFANQLTTATVTYNVSEGGHSSLTQVSGTAAIAQPPYIYTGQLMTDEGSGSGFVPLDRVVLTAAHVIFDDATLSYATGVRWFDQYETGLFEAPAKIPRGSYILSGYAEQRALDNSPGAASAASRQLDAAALYFYEDAAEGGAKSGYLASNSPENNWLTSDRDKFIAGYPVTNVANPGHLYVTDTVQDEFASVAGGVFSTTAIESEPGGSGGPVFVRFDNGNFYPAAIYLGGSQETVVRAIDSHVIDLMQRAEVSGHGGANDSSGGIVQVDQGITGASGYALGSLTVNLLPSGVSGPGTYWQLLDQNQVAVGGQRNSGDTAPGLAPGLVYTVQYAARPGYVAPASKTLTVTAGSTVTINGTYSPAAPIFTSATGATVIEGQPFTFHARVAPNATGYLLANGELPPGLGLDGTTGIISGVVPVDPDVGTGDYQLQLTASNAVGTGGTLLDLNVAAPGNLVVSASGSGKISKKAGASQILPVGSLVTVKATPTSGNIFVGWIDALTGTLLSTQATYTFTMPSALDLQASFVRSPFVTAKGSYLALLQGGTFRKPGFLNLTVTAKGTFTAKFNIGGATATVNNAFDTYGQFNHTFLLSDGSSMDAALTISGSAVLTGTVTSQADGSQVVLSASRTGPHKNAALAGAYTLTIPAPNGNGVPDHDGTGTLTVNKTGGVKFKGTLGDGVKESLAGSLDGNGVWPFLYYRAGTNRVGAELLLGYVDLNGGGGTLSWFRTSDDAFPDGFFTVAPFTLDQP